MKLQRSMRVTCGQWKGSARLYSEGHRRASATYTDTVESLEPTPSAQRSGWKARHDTGPMRAPMKPSWNFIVFSGVPFRS